MKKGVRFLLAGLLTTMAVALSGCGGDKTGGTSSGQITTGASGQEGTTAVAGTTGSITIGIPQDLEDGLDPHKVTAAGTREILFNIYEGLVKYDENGDLKAAVAESYEISEDGLVYTFTLRDGVKFHDGSDVTAEDVIYSINRCKEGDAPLEPEFSYIDTIEKQDDKTIVITLKEADAQFLAACTSAVLPASNADPEHNVIGTGPYKYVSRVPQESITLTAFDEYWGEKAHIRDITLKVLANPDALVMELKGGSVDMIARITDTQAAELAGTDFEVLEGAMNLVQALYLNNSVEPFNDVRVRQALCYATDPQEVMDFVSGGKGFEIGSSMFPTFGKYYDESLNHVYDQDLEKAKALLAEAGYADGFTFSITVPSNYQQHVSTAEVLVEQYKKIGVTAEIKLVEWNSWLEDVYMGRNFESTVIGVDASVLTAPALLSRFESDAKNNFINFSSKDYDAKYEEAVATTDDAKATALYKECLQILADDAANVYIQDLPTFVALNKKYAGYKFYPLYVQDFASLYIVE
ncbi:MAG: ABC transporter substrate-binding protein [Lachnospiraceae bacterium]|nr:ABC transporter substrate-binding protein [Lachnospiraceae bacterium]